VLSRTRSPFDLVSDFFGDLGTDSLTADDEIFLDEACQIVAVIPWVCSKAASKTSATRSSMRRLISLEGMPLL
jgi:hypothetical protein